MAWKVGNGPRPWRERVWRDGKQVQQSFPTKKLADEWKRNEQERAARIRAGLPVQTGTIKLGALIDLYLDNYTAASKPWLTTMLRHPRERFGKVDVHLLRSEQIGAWLHSELDLAPKTKNHILTALRQVLNTGVEWGYLTVSPARPSAVKPPRGSTNATDVRPLESWDEVLKVAGEAGHYGPLIRFACATGLRPQEWAALQWADIDRTNRLLHVTRTVARDGSFQDAGKTAGSLRTVTLSAPAERALDAIVRRIDTPLVFHTPHGKLIRRSNFRKLWLEALDNAGLARRPPYQMRHTFATLALAQGCTLEWVGKELGHRDIGITRKFYARFTKVVDDRMRALLDQLEVSDGTRDTESTGR